VLSEGKKRKKSAIHFECTARGWVHLFFICTAQKPPRIEAKDPKDSDLLLEGGEGKVSKKGGNEARLGGDEKAGVKHNAPSGEAAA